MIRLLVLFLFVPRLLPAQIAFDVKTSLQEKKQLHVIKIALINALQQSNWATVTEVGEDYSLWLTNLRRSYAGDSIAIELDFSLRTPAMMSRGKHISIVRVSISFDTTGISNVQAPNDTLLSGLLVQRLQYAGLLEAFTKLVPGSMVPFGNVFLGSFVSKVLKELSRQPTPFEILEANLVAARAMVELQSMLAEPLPREY